jgi:hypothetical protein
MSPTGLVQSTVHSQCSHPCACAGIKKNGITVFSAHQMGTARMGTSPKNSVVDARGECWHVCNLFVADASLLPTSTGALPTCSFMSEMAILGTSRECKKHCGVGGNVVGGVPKICKLTKAI